MKLVVPVFEGTSDLNLNRGAGRIEGTARIGEAGNVGIAAHRDGFFRVLKDVRVGDTLLLERLTATDTYRIVSTTIVDPSEVSVLAPDGDSVRNARDVLSVLLRRLGAAALHRSRAARNMSRQKKRLPARTPAGAAEPCRNKGRRLLATTAIKCQQPAETQRQHAAKRQQRQRARSRGQRGHALGLLVHDDRHDDQSRGLELPSPGTARRGGPRRYRS